VHQGCAGALAPLSTVDPARRRGGLLLWTVAGSVVIVDRITKLWAEHALTAPRDLIDGVVTLRFTTNSGGAFSLGDRAPLLFAAAATVVCVAIAVTSFRPRSTAQAVALGLILGGATGNLLDRLLRGPHLSGRVIDFIDLHVWPVFNLADAGIVVGALLLAFVALRDGRDPRGDEVVSADDG
jgi:signal peptidase II